MIDHLLADILIAAPVTDLWDAIRNPAKIRAWFGWDADTLTDEIDYIFNTHARVDEGRHILHFEGTPDRFEVEARDEGATLRIVSAAPADERADGCYDDMIEGWISFAQQLRFGMERHRLAERRTLYFSGNAKEGGSGPISALALSTVHGDSETALPVGGVVGSLWHRTPWQIGLTIPQWGDGLLIVTDKPATETAPDGRGMAILTTYGLTDSAFVDLEARWTDWWRDRFEAPSAADAGCA